ncbi:class I SAM-dependent methyltransferase [Frondihabitans australicus]|uniref:16S rRNA (Guanine1207-N2)-methyltransferase n=1 Tax=Frondihabitans australicus TaxID=386892 RepID=A0A495IJZ7_9MICO|nr:class I SAM-dependent methyltransferase [Frondihabitans australicus]RKR76119.1 16S rRNA (guanine1207-N2)-methyltransferase [Frondihabitans australicus]
MPFDFDTLRRRPDFEAPNLVAVDATDRLLLDEAATSLAAAEPGEVVVIGDHYGALTLGAAALHGSTGIRVHQDPLVGERALDLNAAESNLSAVFTHHALDESLVAGARVVLLQLPRSLSALDEIAGLVARHAHPEVAVFAGGRIKHMTLAMNDVLREHFQVVYAGLARQKSRVVTASEPVVPPVESTWPRIERHTDVEVPGGALAVAAYGATFAGARVDIGTRALLDVLPQAMPGAAVVADLGCGSGVLATVAALSRPTARIIASDQSAAAVRSTAETVRLNGVAERVEVLREDAFASVSAGSCDLVLLNPPFHVDAAVEPGVARKLFEGAARVLRPGGELWTVFNSHLGHRSVLEETVGETRQISRNPKFTVTASVRRGSATP